MPNKFEQLVRKTANVGLRTAASGMLLYSTAACGPTPAPTPVKSAAERGVTPVSDQWTIADIRPYRNKEIPAPLVKKIANDMTNLRDYPSVVAGGRLLVDQYDNQKRLQELLPPSPVIKNPFPMPVEFTDRLGGKARAEFNTRTNGNKTYAFSLRDRAKNEQIQVIGEGADSYTYRISLNTALVDNNASVWSYRLLLAKEVSHLLYIRPQIDDVWKAVTKRYDVQGGDEMKQVLWQSGIFKSDPSIKIPSLDPHFDRAKELLDYAGYWHINADVQRLNKEGKLTREDRVVLDFNIALAELTAKRKLIVPNGNGGFSWKEGIGPFSDEWIEVVDAVLYPPKPQSKKPEEKADLNTAGLLLYAINR